MDYVCEKQKLGILFNPYASFFILFEGKVVQLSSNSALSRRFIPKPPLLEAVVCLCLPTLNSQNSYSVKITFVLHEKQPVK